MAARSAAGRTSYAVASHRPEVIYGLVTSVVGLGRTVAIACFKVGPTGGVLRETKASSREVANGPPAAIAGSYVAFLQKTALAAVVNVKVDQKPTIAYPFSGAAGQAGCLRRQVNAVPPFAAVYGGFEKRRLVKSHPRAQTAANNRMAVGRLAGNFATVRHFGCLGRKTKGTGSQADSEPTGAAISEPVHSPTAAEELAPGQETDTTA